MAAETKRPAQSVPTIVLEPWGSCPGDTDGYRSWLPASNSLRGEQTPVLAGDIFEVAEGQAASAIALLSREDAVELSPIQAEEMIGKQAIKRENQIKPFLIRNVVPSFLTSLKAGPVRLDRVGSGLRINAGLFGCGGFKKNPLVVYLPSAPRQVDMQVSAIW